ncbi:MAG: flagellar basal-body rod protein FlgG [Candidatus Puniceispirillum sp.]|nr:flagellar basal-body rod protein FlgG [Candidatus Puniceispirillum sp.]
MTSIALANSASGAQAAQNNVDVIANNIANMKTAGHKERLALFSTLMSIGKDRVGSLSDSSGTVVPVGVQIGLGVQLQAVTPIMTQGNPVQTDNPYHIAIQGSGYFQIEKPNGDTAYTRAGTFEVNADGNLVTQEGFLLTPTITIPQDALWVKIDASGEVSAKIPGNITPQVLGQITLASFANPAGLEAQDGNLFLETPASGAPIIGNPASDGYGKLLQNWYEGSNVNSVVAITSLIEAQRAFELNVKAAKAEDEMEAALNSIV